MRSSGEGAASPRARSSGWRPDSRRGTSRGSGEDGFTLIELLVVVIVLPMIVGAIAIAFVAVISLQASTATRTTNSADAQVLSGRFESDVHSALQITTDPNLFGCGQASSTQTQVFALEWQTDAAVSNGYQIVVSYVVVKSGPASSPIWTLVRQLCTNGTSTVPTSVQTVSRGIPGNLSSPAILPASLTPLTSWVSAALVTSAKWDIAEPAFTYSVLAVPDASTSTAGLPAVVNLANNCQLATPGTGYYAASLCFVDFTAYTATPNKCQALTSGIPGTADTLSFNLCLTYSGPNVSFPTSNPSYVWPSCNGTSVGPVCDASLPTYYSANRGGNGSEAFLGNNGFYIGVGGNAALYQTVLDSTVTLTFKNIALTGPTGVISGWELVTGDAESTDSGESTSWETSNSATFSAPGGTGAAAFSLLPDYPGAPYGTQIDDIGNACATSSNVRGAYLGFTNTDLVFQAVNGAANSLVTCGATLSSDKTGTVMLEAPAPSSMQVVLQGSPGNGHEAIFVGVMLP